MNNNLKLFQRPIKYLSIVISLSITIGCAPVTETIKIDQESLRREESIQREMAKKHKKKEMPKSFKSDALYEARLNRVGSRIQKAALEICPQKNKNKCVFPVKLNKAKVLNAWADGRKIWFTPTMLEFLDDDQELAVIMSHEYAHNLLGHISKKQGNALVGILIDVAAATQGVDTQGAFSNIGSGVYSQGFENEADYVGLYLMYKAGYNIHNVNNIWRKMAIEIPANIRKSYFSSHPSHAERFLRLEKTEHEIAEKKENHQPIQPSYKN